jgi:CRISPR/Cas system-associated exonuclease Cas4 (RecB family)
MSKVKHLSHSAVSDAASCGEKFRLRRIVKVPTIPSWALVGGSAVHTATENLDRQDFGLPLEGPTTFAEAFAEEIERRQQESDTDPETWRASGRVSREWPGKENQKWWLHHGQGMVQNWRSWLTANNFHIWITPDCQPAIELKFETEMFGVPVVGYIDRILTDNRGIYPVDLKSGASAPKDFDQLYLYALAIEEMYGIMPYRASYFMNRTAMSPSCEVKRSVADRITYRITTAAKMVENDIFLPNTSPLCSYCEVRNYCYQWGGEQSPDVLPW